MNQDYHPVPHTLARAQGPGHGLVYRWLSFLLALALTGLVTFGLLPALQKLPAVAPGARIIIDQDIEAGAFYYTDVGKVPEAESFIRGAGIDGEGHDH